MSILEGIVREVDCGEMRKFAASRSGFPHGVGVPLINPRWPHHITAPIDGVGVPFRNPRWPTRNVSQHIRPRHANAYVMSARWDDQARRVSEGHPYTIDGGAVIGA